MVGLSTVKSVHNKAPYVNAEDLGKCHLSFNSHRRGYAFLEGKGGNSGFIFNIRGNMPFHIEVACSSACDYI